MLTIHHTYLHTSRDLQLKGCRLILGEESRRQTNIFVILPTFHQLCLEGGDSLALAAALVTRQVLVPGPIQPLALRQLTFVHVDVNALAQYGDAVSLHLQSALHAACTNGSYEAAKLLVHSPIAADVNLKDGYDATPLHNACAAGHPQLAALLLEHGADPNRQRIDGETPLHQAVRGGLGGHQQCVLLLLAWGGDPLLRGNDGSNSLHTAAECNQPDCCSAILRNHAAKQQQDRITTGNAASASACADGGGADTASSHILHSVDADGNTALHIAMNAGFAPLATALITAGANPMLKNHALVTAVELAMLRIADLEKRLGN